MITPIVTRRRPWYGTGLAAEAIVTWERFWFAPASPGPLGIARLVFFAYLLLWLAPEVSTATWASIDAAFWMPTHLFAALRLQPAPPPVLAVADVLWKLALALACLGIATRISTRVALLLGIYVLGLPQCFGKVDHWSGLLILVMGVLAFARCGDAFSVDAYLARRRTGRDGEPVAPPPASGEYRWPVQLVRLAMVLVFFAAGVAKLRFGGRTWFEPHNMAMILAQPHYAVDRTLPGLGLVLAELPVACALTAALVVLAETAAPLALLGGWLAMVVVGALFALQLGIALLLGVHASFPYLACYAFWLPWDVLERRLAGALVRPTRSVPARAPRRSSARRDRAR